MELKRRSEGRKMLRKSCRSPSKWRRRSERKVGRRKKEKRKGGEREGEWAAVLFVPKGGRRDRGTLV